ncbi:MarR family winged helix-turn-helix transcriptional regulator [Rhizorhabdus dicambivorans]|uniref:MarR family winged helix-turn-helix transcriptional regulator n=1 Tax=Rhizorhabdus dicambivorans TaxID=1850238 RepID=UPI00083524FC|nr:MarR family winged helix-turn-helix transcriptional regulator [Rhizorhabdus dicambivorans]
MSAKKSGAAGGKEQGQGLLPFERLIPARIHKVSDTLEDVARLMLGDAYGLGFTEARILAYLSEHKSASVIDISRDLGVDKAWISRRLQALATRKLLTKSRDGSDSRVILVSLTGKGRTEAERSMDVVRQTYGIIVDGVDLAVADALITRLETNLHDILSQLRSSQNLSPA